MLLDSEVHTRNRPILTSKRAAKVSESKTRSGKGHRKMTNNITITMKTKETRKERGTIRENTIRAGRRDTLINKQSNHPLIGNTNSITTVNIVERQMNSTTKEETDVRRRTQA